MKIHIEIVNKGAYYLVRIINGHTDKVILEFGDHFCSEEEAQSFVKGKFFKNIFEAVLK